MANGSNNRRAGKIYLKVDGVQRDAKGKFSYNLGIGKREPIVGADGIHGYKETPQVPFVEGAITDSVDLDLAAFLSADNVTVTLELANGKTVVFANAWSASEGKVECEEGEVPVRFESRKQGIEQK